MALQAAHRICLPVMFLKTHTCVIATPIFSLDITVS